MRRNKQVNSMWMAWWCRDQNFRKYFEMRKKHGIKPSLKGFYHEPLYKEHMKKEWEIVNMRNSKSASN